MSGSGAAPGGGRSAGNGGALATSAPAAAKSTPTIGRSTPQAKTDAGSKPKHPTDATIRKQIDNPQVEIKREIVQGKTPMQNLWMMLTEKKYLFGHRLSNDAGMMQDLAFAHPDSLRLWEKFSYVMIMDTTYNTIKYDMAFLEIVGLTCTEKTFHLGFAFMSREDEDTYTWVLRQVEKWCPNRPEVILTDKKLGIFKAISNVFPNSHHMLCEVHVHRNIEDEAKKATNSVIEHSMFLHKSRMLFRSKSREEFETRHRDMSVRWGDKWGLMDYLNKTWICHMEKLAWFLTDQHLHLDNRTTNRVESAHAILKQHLGSSTGQLDTCLEHIERMLVDQIRQVRDSLQHSRLTTPTKISELPIFRVLCEKVSANCLERLYKIYLEASTGDFSSECENCYVRSSLGLPCVHEVARIINEKRVFVNQDVHVLWRQVQWRGEKLYDGESPIDVDVDDVNAVAVKVPAGKIQSCSMNEQNFQQLDTQNGEESLTMKDSSEQTPKRRPEKNSVTRERSGFEYTQEKAQNARSKKSSMAQSENPSTGQKRARVMPDGQSATPIDCEDDNIQGGHRQTSTKLPEVRMEGYKFGDENFESFMTPYVQYAQNVKSDGNCGFRALAVLLGRSENIWAEIRASMCRETAAHPERYKPFLRGETMESFRLGLHWLFQGVSAPEAYQMRMPISGVVFATIYQCTLVYLDWFEAYTILPLVREIPFQSFPPPNSIFVLCRDRFKKHFVAVHMYKGHPMPPILKEWYAHHDQSVKDMDVQFAPNIQEFRKLRRLYGRPEP